MQNMTHLICPVFSPRCDKTASLFWGKTLIIVFNAMQHSPAQQNNKQQLYLRKNNYISKMHAEKRSCTRAWRFPVFQSSHRNKSFLEGLITRWVTTWEQPVLYFLGGQVGVVGQQKHLPHLKPFALVTRRPYCPGGPKKLCFTTLSLILMVSIARLSVVKQSFFGGQYGRRVTRVNCTWDNFQTMFIWL